jgi:hypothetical protein
MMGILRCLLVSMLFLAASESLAQTPTNAKKITVPARLQSVARSGTINSQFRMILGGLNVPGANLGLQGILLRDGFESLESPGYRRWVIVFFRADGLAFPRDQQIEVQFGTFESPDSPVAKLKTELKQGALEHRDSFLVPEYFDSDASRVQSWAECKCFADGRELRGLRARSYFNLSNSAATKAKNIHSEVVVVASRKKLLSEFDAEFSAEEKKELKKTNVYFLTDRKVAIPEWLPEDWRELMSCNTIVIDAESFDLFNDEQLKSLRRFVYAGGELILARVNGKDAIDKKLESWFEGCSNQKLSESVSKINSTYANLDSRLCSEVGFGRILLTGYEASFFHENGEERGSVQRVAKRSSRLFDVDMMEWTIEKIGRPPVWLFLASIIAFTFGAGPGLMWLLNQRLKRPIWLLAIFPVLAALITLSIFGFAFFNDGLGIHGRLRSLTKVDLRTGQGCVYSRQTYFSGFPPKVARFHPETEVFAIRSDHEGRNFRPWDATSDTQSLLELTEESQDFRDLLTARQQNQWIATRPLEDFRPFEFVGEPEGDSWQIRNKLKEAWMVAVFVDSEKRIWKVDNAAKENVAKLRIVDQPTAFNSLKSFFPVDRFPVGYFDTPDQSLFDWFSSSSYYNYSISQRRNRTNGLPVQGYESLPDDWLQRNLKQANQFMIVLEQGIHVDRPFGDRVRESDSSHIVVGTW